MWPFRQSKTARRERVVQFALDATTLSFGDYMAGRQLVQAMHADPYLLGYLLVRLQGMTRYACLDAHLSDEAGALAKLVLVGFFGADCAALLARAETVTNGAPPARERYFAGANDAQIQCDYLFGAREVSEHPRYAEAVRRERSAAAAMPGNRFNGTPAAIAHHLERCTFPEYLARAQPCADAPAAHSHAA